MYKNYIMDEIKHLQMTSSNYEMPILGNVPKYIGGMEKPEKSQTISNLKSRIKQKSSFRFDVHSILEKQDILHCLWIVYKV